MEMTEEAIILLIILQYQNDHIWTLQVDQKFDVLRLDGIGSISLQDETNRRPDVIFEVLRFLLEQLITFHYLCC